MLYQGNQGHQWFNKKRGALRASMIRFLSTDFTDLTDVGYAALNLRFNFLTSDLTDLTDFCCAFGFGRDDEGGGMLYQDNQGHQWFNRKRGVLRASMIRFFIY